MDVRHAEIIATILREGNISKAANVLFISQPALSQTLKRLEAELGTQILDRGSNPICLTYAGRKYLDAMSQVKTIQTELLNEINEINNEHRGLLRLGISSQRCIQLLPVVMPDFNRLYPRVRMDLEEHGSALLEKMLHDGSIDIALITTAPRYEDLEYILLESEEVVLMASEATTLYHQFPDGSEIDIASAKGEQFVSLTQNHSVRTVQDRLFQENSLNPVILIETDVLEAAKRLAASANAVMLCPYVFINQSPEVRSSVHCYHIKGLNYKRHFYFVHRKTLYLTHFMKDFLRILQNKLRQDYSATL